MSETVTDADRLAAEGVPIPTARGELRLVYGFRALRRLEDTYGGVGELQDAMQQLLNNLETTGKGRAFGPVLDIVIPGLLHTGLSEDELLDALQPRHLALYAAAMAEAMRQSFPDATLDGVGNDPAQAAPVGSPGPSGTTSQPAATAEPTASSGA